MSGVSQRSPYPGDVKHGLKLRRAKLAAIDRAMKQHDKMLAIASEAGDERHPPPSSSPAPPPPPPSLRTQAGTSSVRRGPAPRLMSVQVVEAGTLAPVGILRVPEHATVSTILGMMPGVADMQFGGEIYPNEFLDTVFSDTDATRHVDAAGVEFWEPEFQLVIRRASSRPYSAPVAVSFPMPVPAAPRVTPAPAPAPYVPSHRTMSAPYSSPAPPPPPRVAPAWAAPIGVVSAPVTIEGMGPLPGGLRVDARATVRQVLEALSATLAPWAIAADAFEFGGRVYGEAQLNETPLVGVPSREGVIEGELRVHPRHLMAGGRSKRSRRVTRRPASSTRGRGRK